MDFAMFFLCKFITWKYLDMRMLLLNLIFLEKPPEMSPLRVIAPYRHRLIPGVAKLINYPPGFFDIPGRSPEKSGWVWLITYTLPANGYMPRLSLGMFLYKLSSAKAKKFASLKVYFQHTIVLFQYTVYTFLRLMVVGQKPESIYIQDFLQNWGQAYFEKKKW